MNIHNYQLSSWSNDISWYIHSLPLVYQCIKSYKIPLTIIYQLYHYPIFSHLTSHPHPLQRAHRWHASNVSASVTGAWSPEGSTSRQRKKCCLARFRSWRPRWWLGDSLAPWDGMKTWKNMDLFEANSMVKRCEKCILLANWIGMKSGYAPEFTWIHMNSHEFTWIHRHILKLYGIFYTIA